MYGWLSLYLSICSGTFYGKLNARARQVPFRTLASILSFTVPRLHLFWGSFIAK
jgi:hypothetical protein